MLVLGRIRPRGGVVTQRTANPYTPVRFRAWPPIPRFSLLACCLPVCSNFTFNLVEPLNFRQALQAASVRKTFFSLQKQKSAVIVLLRKFFTDIFPIAALALATFYGVLFYEDLRDLLSPAGGKSGTGAGLLPSPSSGRGGADLPPSQERQVRLFVEGNGHFQTFASVNDQLVEFVIDTGASVIALRYEDAQKAGLAKGLAFTGTTQTANGVSTVAPITIPVLEIGPIKMTNLRAHVARPGHLAVNLLGMNFIRRLARFEMRGEELVLVQGPPPF